MNENNYELKVNDRVMTPNGVGVLQGQLFDDGSGFVMVVRHRMEPARMMTEGKCLTPSAKMISGLWAYKVDDVTLAAK
jgi:hypothetical protein